MWWDTKIKTLTKLEHNRPDIVLWKPNERKCYVIDISVGLDVNVSKNHQAKIVDLFTDNDAKLDLCPVEFCLKWTLYFVSTSTFMKEYQFSRLFDFGKLFNMSVKVYIFMKALTIKKFSYTLGRVIILQHWTKS